MGDLVPFYDNRSSSGSHTRTDNNSDHTEVSYKTEYLVENPGSPNTKACLKDDDMI